MAYDIERTDEFTAWWDSLTEAEQIEVARVIGALAEKGPDLRRPYVGKLEGSKKIPNLKELVVQYGGDPYRVFFVFDPRRMAILLLGAKKTGGVKAEPAWYRDRIAEVEPIYEQYLAELRQEGFI